MSLSLDKAKELQNSTDKATKSPMSPTTPQSAEDMMIDYTEMDQYMKQERLGLVAEDDSKLVPPVSPGGPPKTPQAPVDFMLDFEDMEEYLDSKKNSKRRNNDNDGNEDTEEEIPKQIVNQETGVVPVVTDF